MDLYVLEKYRVEEVIKANAEFNRFCGETQTEWSWTNHTEDSMPPNAVLSTVLRPLSRFFDILYRLRRTTFSTVA